MHKLGDGERKIVPRFLLMEFIKVLNFFSTQSNWNKPNDEELELFPEGMMVIGKLWSIIVKFPLMSRLMTEPTKWLWAQWRLGSAWASAQSISIFAAHSMGS